ncbi:MAG: hypothetical protein SFZ24_04350 [Planctomycetota bacterium]|nr:hypothetical protein [Planctomycetota bacterium]
MSSVTVLLSGLARFWNPPHPSHLAWLDAAFILSGALLLTCLLVVLTRRMREAGVRSMYAVIQEGAKRTSAEDE